MEGFGQRIIERRAHQGWTRRELAQRAGLHEQHLAKVERGDRQRIEAETIIKLARVLEVSADFLLGLTNDPRPRRRLQRPDADAEPEEVAPRATLATGRLRPVATGSGPCPWCGEEDCEATCTAALVATARAGGR